MLSVASFLRTLASGSCDSSGVKTPTRIVLSISSERPGSFYRSCLCYLYAFDGDRLRHTRTALFVFLSLLIFAGLMLAQDQPAVDPSVAVPPHAKQVRLKHILVIG